MWLSSDVTDNEILADLPNFNVFRNDRKGARGGGVLIATSRSLSCSVVDITSDIEILWLRIRSTPLTLLLGVCYRPPQSSPDFPEKLNNILNYLTVKQPNAHVLLFGDFNYPDVDWKDQVALAGSSALGKRYFREHNQVCFQSRSLPLPAKLPAWSVWENASCICLRRIICAHP